MTSYFFFFYYTYFAVTSLFRFLSEGSVNSSSTSDVDLWVLMEICKVLWIESAKELSSKNLLIFLNFKLNFTYHFFSLLKSTAAMDQNVSIICKLIYQLISYLRIGSKIDDYLRKVFQR